MAMYSERVLRWLKLCIELFDKLVKCFLLCLRFLGISPVLVGILLWCDEINVLNYTSHGLLLLATIPIVVVIEDDLRERTVAKRAVHHLGPIIVSYAVRRINQFSPWLFLLIWSTVLLALVPATLRSGRRILADELSTELTFSAFSALIWGVCQSLALFAHIENIMRHIFVLALLFVVDYRRNWRTLLLLVLLGFYQSFTISNIHSGLSIAVHRRAEHTVTTRNESSNWGPPLTGAILSAVLGSIFGGVVQKVLHKQPQELEWLDVHNVAQLDQVAVTELEETGIPANSDSDMGPGQTNAEKTFEV